MHSLTMPVAVTIAGSDSGGDAGLQADLKTFNDLRVHGTTAITCVTAQNPGKVSRLEPCSPKMVRAQLEAIAAYFSPKSAKTGMLYSEAIVREVAKFFSGHQAIKLVIDPVMIATSGRRLLEAAGVEALKKNLLPLAALVTPNLDEAQFLLGRRISSPAQLRDAAREIFRCFGCAALVKGGHLNGGAAAMDFFHGPEGEWMISSPRAPNVALHGTGCAYSAAIAAWLARGKTRIKAIELAKTYVTRRIYEARGQT